MMDDILFILGKIFLFILNFENFIFFSFIFLIFIYFLNFKKLLKIYIISLITFIIIISIIPIGQYYIYNLENENIQKPIPDKIDGIMLLAGSIDPDLSIKSNQISLNELSERLLYFVFLSNKYPDAKLLYSGGSSNIFSDNYPSLFAKKYFEMTSLKNINITYDNNARNTYESFKNFKQLTDYNNSEKWILITSASHMKRSMLTACKFGLNFIPYVVDKSVSDNLVFFNLSKNIKNFFNFLRIYFAICYYKLTDRSC